MTNPTFLSVDDHNRDVTGMTYVYPVVSRRAGGISIGINLNINNACNWRCIYCQVPNLKRGFPPPLDAIKLENELKSFLKELFEGDFLEKHVDKKDRQLQDIAFSGNGEPTSCKEFPEAIAIVEKVLHEFSLLDPISSNTLIPKPIKVRVITNGSMMDKTYVLNSIEHLARINGEVWFKVDAGTPDGILKMNDVNMSVASVIKRLNACAKLCPTFVQTCMLSIDGAPPSDKDVDAYIQLLKQVSENILGVHLYGLARPSFQKEAPRLSRLSESSLNQIADKIRKNGIPVFVSP
jgi:wyosine [tRNA(Phe)-imidazoG37] synthetase (radical SAM superfamily)